MDKRRVMIVLLPWLAVTELVLGFILGSAIAELARDTSQIQCHGHTEDSCKYAWVNGRPMIVDATP